MEAVNAIIVKLDEMFPKKNLLCCKDIAEYTGLSMPTVKKRYGLSRGVYIDKRVLAMKLAGK